MSTLLNNDVAMAGLWRGWVVQIFSDGTARVFIPTLQRRQMPFKNLEDPSEGIIEGCEGNYIIANSVWWKVRTELKVGDPVWIMFENGNANFPIIVGLFGSVVPLASEFSGTLNSSVPGSATYGDSTVVDMSGKLKENGKISKVQYLILHTSGCHSVDSLINVLAAQGLGVQAATDDKAIYKLTSEWDSLVYHCAGVNSIAIGCEQIESPHIKWNANMTAIPDQEYMKAHIAEIIEWHDKCYNNAVNLFAYWCITFGLTEANIYSHKESPKIGGTLAHGDPEALWDYFVKHTGDKKWTMDAFREAVKKRIPELRVTTQSGSASGYTKYVFVGDSRTCGMYSALGGNYADSISGSLPSKSSEYFISKVGMGYSWFTSPSIQSEISSQIASNTALIILMGCNDAYTSGMGTKYVKYIREKLSQWTTAGATVYFVSVNPVDDANAEKANYRLKDSNIVSFNSEIKTGIAGNNIKYIDTYTSIKSSFKASDGIHYDNATYEKIYNIIKGQ